MADYIRKQIDVDGSYIFPYTHADAVLYTTQNNLDGITSGTETNVKAVLDALDNTYRRLDANITSLYNSLGKRGFLYLNGTTTTASMELPTLGNNFYVPTLKYDSNGNITTAWQTPASIAAAADLSGYVTTSSSKNMSINGTNYSLYTSASSLPTIIAPTAYASTGGYILATNANKNGLEWVAKPTSNITTSAVVASASTGTSLITAALSDPYYNLLEGGSVTRSIQFKAGTGITVQSSTAGVITITNSSPDVNHNVSTSAVLSTSASGTSQISATLSDPYYNLIEGSSVARSILFKAGTGMTVSTTTAGVITFTNSLATKNISINGTNYALYTSASSLPTIYAPTSLAGTGGYILATNSGKTAVEWVAKPTSNVTTSAVVSSSASGTSQITAAQSNPYYNLIEGSSVARSIRFVAGTGISISAATDGQITITNTVGSSSITSVAGILASTSTGTSAISGDTLDPYYNLLVNSAVNSSVLYKAGTNMTITADTNNVITFNNTLNTMSKLTNDLFINGTLTAATGSWKGNLPAGITALYNGLTIFYRLPYAGSGNASLQLYASDGTTTIGANCAVYAGNTRLTTHYPLYSIIPMTYYDGVWRANPYYNSNNYVTLSNTTTTTYRPLLLGYLDNASSTGIPTTAVTNLVYKTTNVTVSPAEGRMYLSSDTANVLHGYFTRYSTSGNILGLAIGTDGVERGIRDGKNGTWLCYCDDTSGESLKVPGTLIPQVINLAEHCLIAYDSTNQCINFTFS